MSRLCPARWNVSLTRMRLTYDTFIRYFLHQVLQEVIFVDVILAAAIVAVALDGIADIVFGAVAELDNGLI